MRLGYEWEEERTMALEGEVCTLAQSLSGPLGALVGAAAVLVGARMTSRVTSRVDKERRTLELLTAFQRDAFPLQRTAYAALKHPSAKEERLNEAKWLGNWYDMFAVLIDKDFVDETLIVSAELDQEMRKFLKAVKASPGGGVEPRKDWPNLWRRYEGGDESGAQH